MLTVFTQTAIAVLQDISLGTCLESATFRLSEDELRELLQKLESGELIRLLPDRVEGLLSSYELCRPLRELSLLEVIEATGEPINCKYPTPESFYSRHGRVAQKMGVANHMVRLFLNDIKLCDW
jgi:DNA-binding IscR family transcriptional regulator